MENIDKGQNNLGGNDLDTTQWHDCKIYAIAFDNERFELMFDIDYIMKWLKPEENESHYKFNVAPATLVFKNVHDININVDSVDLVIQEVIRDSPSEPKNAKYIGISQEYRWTIETTNGEIAFNSTGYDQFVRGASMLLDCPSIGLATRNGISFARVVP